MKNKTGFERVPLHDLRTATGSSENECKCPECEKKREHTSKSTSKIIPFIFAIIISWIVISSFIQRFQCEEMTETQIFLHIPKSFICDWQYCD